MSQKDETRSHEHVVTIDAEPEAVWRAITEAEELTRWFPLEASVSPGKDGVITLSWGPGAEGSCRIEAWEPPRHLKTSWMDPQAQQDAPRIAVDWFIEGKGGQTVLRLVHSGFGEGEKWDGEYDSTNRGWEFELRSLQHYLKHHAGRKRTAFWVRKESRLSADQVWQRLMGGKGLFSEGSLDGLGAGDRYAVTLSTGQRLEGTVLIHTPMADFAGTVENLSNGIFRLGFEECFGVPQVQLWLSTWGETTVESKAIQQRWREALEEILA